MSTVPKPIFTIAEYVAHEERAATKSEFYRGELFAMVGGSIPHNTISGNVFAFLRNALRGSGCRPHNSDQRVRVVNSLITYPDVSITCGEIETDEEDPQAITNPVAIVEVLSSSTERYDRGKKFGLYRDLTSLQEYILISQNAALVEKFERNADNTWVLTVFEGLDASLEFNSVPARVPLAAIYEDVEFEPDDGGESEASKEI